MPTYQYRCSSCGFEFEEMQSMNADPIKVCPQCGKEPQRVISGGAGLLFKGSGFYITDYRSDSYKSSAKNDPSSSSTPPPPASGSDSSRAEKAPKDKSPSGGDSAKTKPAETPKPNTSSSTTKKSE